MKISERKKCYICNKEIRFFPSNNFDGFIKCDYCSHIVNRNPDGEIYYDANGRPFRAIEAPPGVNTVSIGYKLHHCQV